MKNNVKHYLHILITVFSLVLMPCAANAATLYCDTTNGGHKGYIYYTGNEEGSAAGKGACAYNGLDHIIGTVLCNFMVIVNDVMGDVYCGIQSAIQTPLAILLTIYIAIFGMQILMGTTKLNAKEIITRLLKIAGVWTFATRSDWAIGKGLDFFFGLISDSLSWVFCALQSTISDFPKLDTICDLTNNTQDNTGIMPLFGYIDTLVYNTITGPALSLNSKVAGFLMVVCVVYPPALGLIVSWLLMTLGMLVRAIVGFMLGVSAIAFLIALSPIFLSFMLFRVTYHLFDQWLKFMISYSLQIVIVFVCVSLWTIVMFKFVDFFNDIESVVFSYQKVEIKGSENKPQDTWGLCPFTVTSSDKGPRVSCKDPGFYTVGINPYTGKPDPTYPDADAEKNKDLLIPITDIFEPAHKTDTPADEERTRFLFFITYHFIALIMISFAFSELLRQSSVIAVGLAGPSYVPILGAGFGPLGIGERGIKTPRWFGSFNERHGSSGSYAEDLVNRTLNDVPSSRGSPTKNIVDQYRTQVSQR